MSKQIINKLEIISEVFPRINGAVDGDMLEIACVGCINQGVIHDNSCNCKAQAIAIEFELRKKGILSPENKVKTFLLSRDDDVIVLGVMADIISGRNILRCRCRSCSDRQLMTILGRSVAIKIVCNEGAYGIEITGREYKDKTSLYYRSSVDAKLNYGELPSRVESSMSNV